jgi:seryl-tRNA synthetase
MLTIPYIREHRDEVIRLLKIKNFDATTFIDQLIGADNSRRELQVKTNDLQAEMNKISKEIGMLFKQGEHEQASQAKIRTAEIKASIKELSNEMQEAVDRMNKLLVQIPNVPNELVPPGRSEEDNVMVREGGKNPSLDEKALPHWELAKKYDIIDFDLGVKLTVSSAR